MRKLLLVSFLWLAISASSNAQLLQYYGFAGNSGSETTAGATGQPTNGTLTTIRRGSGVTPNAAANAFGATGFTTATSPDTADYFAFGIRPAEGFVLKLDSVVVGERRSNTGPRSFVVRSSADNYASDLGIFSVPDDANFRNNQKLVLGSAFQNLGASATTFFRYYGFAAENETGSWRLDSIRLYGQIFVSGPQSSSVGFAVSTQVLPETTDSLRIEVLLNPTSTSTFQTQVVIKSGSALAGTDYEIPANNGLIFLPGQTSATLKIKLKDDALTDGPKTLNLVLREQLAGSFANAEIGPDSLQSVTLTDNEAPVVSGIPFTRTIAQVRGNNTDGQADSVGRNVRLFGTVYGVNQRLTASTGGYQLFLRDATGGIGVFKNNPVSGVNALNEGDSIKIMGKIEVFRGLSQINPDSMVVLATGRPLKNPVVTTSIGENQEGDLLRINNLTLVNPAAWTPAGTGFTVQVSNGTTTYDVRIDNDCPLFNQPAPTGTFSLIGMGGQFASSTTAPFTGGYQIIPRKLSDLISNPVVGPRPKVNFTTAGISFTESTGVQNAPILASSVPSVIVQPAIFQKGGNATAGIDFEGFAHISTTTGPGQSLSFNLGPLFQDDLVSEGAETLVVVLRKLGLPSDTAYDIGPDSIFTFTINDNDAPVVSGIPFTRTIAQVRGTNTDGQADSVGRNVRLFGTVYGLNQRLTASTGGYQLFLRDATGGIGVFKNNPVSGVTTLNEGDSIKIMGKIEVFRGLSQINPDSMVVLATGRPQKAPLVTTTLGENEEADLLRLNNLTLVNPAAWTPAGAGFTVQVSNGTTTYDVRIDNDCPLFNQPAPTGTFSLIGMGGQFASSTTAPFTGGYQIIPRKLTDLISNPVVGPRPKVNFTTAGISFTESTGVQNAPILASSVPSVIVQPAIFQKGGNATAGIDFEGFAHISTTTGPGQSLSFNLGPLFQDDLVSEGTETLVVVLRKLGLPSDTAYDIGPDSIFTFTINDNDAPVVSGIPFTRTIAQVRGNNTDGQADSVGRNVRLFGTVYGVNQRLTASTGGYQLFMRDATGGIGVFKTTPINGITTLNEGDSIKIMGKIEVFRGLSQINPDSMVVLATGRPQKAPVVTTTLGENEEADLLRLNNLTLVNPAAWTPAGTGFTVQVSNGTTTFDVRIDNDCPLFNQPAPTGTFALIGMGGQFASSTTAPFTGGYQLIPRKLTDLIPFVAPGSKPVLRFLQSSGLVAEANANYTTPIQASTLPSVDIQPYAAVKGGTATNGVDFSFFQGIQFSMGPAQQTTVQAFIDVLEDVLPESTESVILVLRKVGLPNDTAYTIGSDSIFTFFITDNDSPTPAGPPFTRTIAQVRGTNTNGQADSVGRNVRLFGTVYGVNQRLTASTGGYQLFMRDATGGIGVFKTTPINGITTLNEGDSIKIMGKIEVFRGLSQINPDSMVVLATGRPQKAPVVVTTALEETQEADLLRLNNLTLVNPAAWTPAGAGFTVQVTNGTTTYDVRIDNDCPLFNQPAPTGGFSLIGMGAQFATSTTAPFTGGYQLIPRKLTDLIPDVSVDPLCSCVRDLQVFPNPGSEVLFLNTKLPSEFRYTIFNGLGQEVYEIPRAKAEERIDIRNWPAGVYSIKVEETGKVYRWIKR